MYLTSTFTGLLLVSGVVAATCNANNCARAVTGTRTGKMPDVSSRMADCSSFQMVTVTPATSTVTTTATVTITNIIPGKRDNGNGPVTVSPSSIPAYASPCSNAAAYSSACSCWGITATTITVPTPVTTVTVTATVTVSSCPTDEILCSGSCKSINSDPNNCGACGNVCASGICNNGACSNPSCTGQTCATFSACGAGGSCVCGSTTDSTGFCVDGSTPCSGLPTCTGSSDCASGQVCIVGSCCGVNVCVGASFCGGNTARMIFARDPAIDTIGHKGDGV
ncbi:hypothetical protein BR93DRAFT_994235 [Coniochaeta sp. PMI_546]|nr:hypothetical protein BR93DRAFT_994235 [Coniochaeta sp. PMI_546]